MFKNSIDTSAKNSEKISGRVEQVTFNAVRKVLPDHSILQACKSTGYTYRERKITPITTVLHMIMAAIERDVDLQRISFVHAIRAIISFSPALASSGFWQLPQIYQAMLTEIASELVPERPGRMEPRMVRREGKHYPSLKMTRTQWRQKHVA